MNNKNYTDLVESGQYPSDPLVPLDPPFVDERGSIQNLLNTPICGAAIITSRAGTTRSNHKHTHDYHFLHVISGSMLYYERDPDQDGSTIIPVLYGPGQMVFTPPGRVHKTTFPQDCVMLSFSKRNRDHDSHESDLIRVEF